MRVLKILKNYLKNKMQNPILDPILEIKNLRKIYQNKSKKTQLEALKNISLTVQSGDFYALLGKNGAGKSTAISLITSLIKKTSGLIKINGLDLDQYPIDAKKNIGVVPQEFNFNPFEKVENILINQAMYYGISLDKARERSEILLKEMDLYSKKNSAARQLSGGMKRRMMIARALMHEPKILILDEPTAGVDIEIRQAMWKFLKKINQEQGVTIILTTHYLEEAENLCNKIAVLDQGKIIRDSLMADFLKELEFETVLIELCESSLLSAGRIQDSPLHQNFPVREINKNLLEIDLLKNQSLDELVCELKKLDLKIYRVRNKSNRLEQLLMNLTQENQLNQLNPLKTGAVL